MNTGDLSSVSEATRATTDYYWVILAYLYKGQDSRFSHDIFCFKMGLLKEIGEKADGGWQMKIRLKN